VNTWVSWADGKAWANPRLSTEIYKEAQPALKFEQFCEVPDDFGPGQGSDYYYAIEQALSPGPLTIAGSTLSESSPIPLDDWGHLRDSVSVIELGRGASYSKKMQLLSKWSMDSKTRSKLRDHYIQIMDLGAATQFRASHTYYIPTGVAAGTYGNDNTPAAEATANLTLYHLKEIRDYMAGTLKVPGWDDNGNYIALLNTKAARGLKNDADVEQVQLYAEPQRRLNGELYKIEGFRVIEINNVTSLPNVSAACGGGVFFGKESVQKPVVVAPTVLAESTGDFGRVLRLAWWGILGWGLIWKYTTHSGSRIIRLAST